MGNEQKVISCIYNTNDALHPQTLKRQSTGADVHTSLHENITKALETYGTNEHVANQVEKHQQRNKLCFVQKENIISHINKSFICMQQLGSSARCHVLKAKNISNNKLYAIKKLNKKRFSLFSQEVQLLKKLHHPNILRYYDCYVDNKYYYIATEYCSGGTMLDKLIRMKYFSERKASQYIRSILSAVNYMHSLNIVHRDIKLQNCVFSKAGIDGVVQIIDFGDSKIVNDDKVYNKFIGTIFYLPPEIIRPRSGKELKKSDLWSIGVVTYLLVCGFAPFFGNSNEEILSNIVNKKKKKLFFPKYITAACKNFIQGLLCYDTSDRMSAAQALKHEWICGPKSVSVDIGDDDIDWAWDFLEGLDDGAKVEPKYSHDSTGSFPCGSSINLDNI